MKQKTVPILIVTKGNTDGSVIKGDRVCYFPDGSLNLLHPKYGGWMSRDELTPEITDFEYVVDQKYERVITSRGQYTVKKRA
jgi:hypothetical protein